MKEKLSGGKLLIAEPFMQDVYFKRSVVLLCENSKHSTFGFILNKRLDIKINELVLNFPEFDGDLYFGGPVQNDTLHFIHTIGDVLDDCHQIAKGLYWGGNYNQLKALIKEGLVSNKDIKFFVGYSGWDLKQFKEEMNNKNWIVEDINLNYIFNSKDEILWKQVLNNKGNVYSVLSELPDYRSLLN